MPSIDPKVIADLRALEEGGSPGFLAELIDLFLKEEPQYRARLRDALARRDAALLERAAHTLKGSGGNLGAKELSGLASRLQDVARAANWAEAALLLEKIETEAAAVEKELLAEKLRGRQ
jgi:HPt (histidine-containing phosphotransfer) domain-containing protein